MHKLIMKMKYTGRRVVAAITCHHALYGYLAVLYGAGCAGVMDKDVVAQGAVAIYAALSLRG